MLVTLGSGQTISGGAQETYNYACNSVQGVMVRVEDDTSDAQSGHLTVQIGNEVIVNDINFRALALLTSAKGGFGEIGTSALDIFLNLGSHILDANESLYVTVRNASGTNLTAVDISALVDGAGTYSPIKITNYNDSVFTDSNTLEVYAWADAVLDEDASVFTVRNQAYSSAPSILSGVSWTLGSTQIGASAKYFATMAKNQVPMNTSINYTSAVVDGVLCISGMDRMPSKQAEASRTGRNLVRSMSSSEAKAL